MIDTETTAIFRKSDAVEDITDSADLLREAEARGFNAGLDLAAAMARLNGQKSLAALFRRQRKFVGDVL
jgi:hypothetical protein